MKEPVAEAIAVAEQRYSPQVAGYKEIPNWLKGELPITPEHFDDCGCTTQESQIACQKYCAISALHDELAGVIDRLDTSRLSVNLSLQSALEYAYLNTSLENIAEWLDKNQDSDLIDRLLDAQSALNRSAYEKLQGERSATRSR